MSTKFYIKKDDTSEPLKVVIRKRQVAVNGVVPPDILWMTGSHEQQFIQFSAVPDEGTWKLAISSNVSGITLSYNAPAVAVKDAIEVISGIGVGNVSVTGDYSVGFTVVFNPSLDNVGSLSQNTNSLKSEAENVTIHFQTIDEGSIETVSSVTFSMKKIPQELDDGTTLNPNGTITQTDGTILNPLGNTDVVLSGIRLLSGEILNPDYTVTQVDGSTRYPNGIIELNSSKEIDGVSYDIGTQFLPTGYNNYTEVSDGEASITSGDNELNDLSADFVSDGVSEYDIVIISHPTLALPIERVVVSVSSSTQLILNEDFTVTKTDARYSVRRLGEESICHPILLQNGMIKLPPIGSYPQGYILNPNDINRLNFYKVGNPTENPINPDGTITLPTGCYLDSSGDLNMPTKVMLMPEGVTLQGANLIKLPDYSTVTLTNNIVRLPTWDSIHPIQYSVTRIHINSEVDHFEFPSGSTLEIDENNHTARIKTIISLSTYYLNVPYNTIEISPAVFAFPYRVDYVSVDRKFSFWGEELSFPTSVTFSGTYPTVTAQFPSGTKLYKENGDIAEVTGDIISYIELFSSEKVPIRNKLLSTASTSPTAEIGDVVLYNNSVIKLNSNNIVRSDSYILYSRGTIEVPGGGIIHPNGTVVVSPYNRYYPVKNHPAGLLVTDDGSIVNGDGTFTQLDNSVIDSNGQYIQTSSTASVYYEATSVPPFVPPAEDEESYIVINQKAASFSTLKYAYGDGYRFGILLSYDWDVEDTSHEGLYSGEFTVNFSASKKRTFPVLKDDALLIEILPHFTLPPVEEE